MFIAGSLTLVDQQAPQLLQPLRQQSVQWAEPLYVLASYPPRAWVWLTDSLHSDASLRRENTLLKTQLLATSVRLQRFAELSAENSRLRGLLESSAAIDGPMQLVEVIGADPDPTRQMLIINKGQQDNVYMGEPLLDAQGIMGQVVGLAEHTASVLLVSDSRHSIPVRSQRSGVRAILGGTGEGQRLKLFYVPDSADIRVADVLVSSGLGQRYPAGYPVAVVNYVKRSGGGEFTTIYAQPIASLDSSRYAVLLASRPLNHVSP